MNTLFLISFLFQATAPTLPAPPNLTIERVAETFSKELADDKAKCLVTAIKLDVSFEYQKSLIERIQQLEKENEALKTPQASKDSK